VARVICRLCGRRVHPEDGRTGHLKHAHGIEPYKGCVRDYFLHPWEAHQDVEIDALPVGVVEELEDAYDKWLEAEEFKPRCKECGTTENLVKINEKPEYVCRGCWDEKGYEYDPTPWW